MAKTIRIEVDRAAVGAILKGPEVRAMLQDKVDRIAARAGDGYEAEVRVGRTRARGTVRTETFDAILDNAANGTLHRALDAGR